MPEVARQSGRAWSSGPYVRVGERDTWNAVYDDVQDELRSLRRCVADLDLTDEQIDTIAWNVAYRRIWSDR